MRTWQHSGFSVDKSVRLAAGDTAAVERLTQYIVRCPFSLDRILSLNPDGKVVYRAESRPKGDGLTGAPRNVRNERSEVATPNAVHFRCWAMSACDRA